MDAGPHVRERIDPQLFESWVGSLAELGDIELGVQLHGGEPLMMDPSVELYAAIARNAFARWPTSRLGSMGLVTNGLLLDAARAESLRSAGLHVVISVDGPERIHDQFRLNVAGHGSHRRAMQAVDVMRSLKIGVPVLAVATQPGDVLEILEFFIAEGLSQVRINPVRPEGRGVGFPGDDPVPHMRRMAEQHALAALRMAEHNLRFPDRPIYEDNIHTLMSKVMKGDESRGGAASWTLLVDDRGGLWSHPGGYGAKHMRLTSGEAPSAALLSRVLGLGQSASGNGRANDRASRLSARQAATFRPCAGCTEPMWCTGFRPLVGGQPDGSPDADCVWRIELTEFLRSWWETSPDEAQSVVRPAGGSRGMTRPRDRTERSSSGRRRLDEPLHPTVQAILNDVHVSQGGLTFIDEYADWVVRLKKLNVEESQRVFIQLALLARNYADLEDSTAMARSLAHLARIGLVPLVRASHRRQLA